MIPLIFALTVLAVMVTLFAGATAAAIRRTHQADRARLREWETQVRRRIAGGDHPDSQSDYQLTG